MGDRGRLVVPRELREHQQWQPGTRLLFVETENGVLVTTRDGALRAVRDQLGRGKSLAEELSRERRAAAAQEDRS
jgi:bifunctional DNA-binding transcriptional regulator/antitoxin component of YhaV-PrlF toxin-antitoxin module